MASRKLPASTRSYKYEEQPKMREKFERLKKREDYHLVIATLARYVRSTIPAPADTAGTLWVVTARIVSTCHNETRCYLQSCTGEFCWHYRHRA